MEGYPILDIVPDIQARLRESNTVILQAPPGAGKSTVLPLHLIDAPWLEGKKIYLLQPRRLAARSVAERLAEGLNESVGERAGYRVRFESRVTARTRIEVVTEGILTRLLQQDPSLEDSGLVIFDEFHERSLQADLAFVLARQVQRILRPDLRILIMSATLDAAYLSAALPQAPVITSQGRQFPVSIQYASTESTSPLPARVAPAVRRALREHDGDVLVFLPGTGEIRKTQELLEAEGTSATILPLYGDLPSQKQREAILPLPGGARKVVLATSIAETSLTIEGITVVVDSGYARVPRFDPNSGLTRLETVRVTRDAADQRAGRAGRLGPGTCYRLWTEGAHRHLAERRKPEILEADLAGLVLEAMAWDNTDLLKLEWLTPPPPGAVSQASDLLRTLKAIDDHGITDKGKAMVQLPTHPRLAHLLLEATTKADRCLASDIAAIIEERDPLPKEMGADLRLRVEVLRRWRSGERVAAERSVLERIEKLSAQWRRLLQTDIDNIMPDAVRPGVLLLAAYPERLCQQKQPQQEVYTMTNGRSVRLPDHDPLLHEPWICAGLLDLGEKTGRIFLAAPVDVAVVTSMARAEEVMGWDAAGSRVTSSRRLSVGALVIQSTTVPVADEERKNAVLMAQIREKGMKWAGWTEGVEEFVARLASLRHWRMNEAWPDITESQLLETLDQWLTPYLIGVVRHSDLERLNWQVILTGLVPYELQSRINTLAPAQIEVPSGSLIKVHYKADGGSPHMEVRLQELFGLARTPAVNEGRIPVVMHLLSPGYKPVQVTSDLESFWHGAYHEVRKELKRRYPKHSWPEDPWTAEAVRGVKRRS